MDKEYEKDLIVVLNNIINAEESRTLYEKILKPNGIDSEFNFLSLDSKIKKEVFDFITLYYNFE